MNKRIQNLDNINPRDSGLSSFKRKDFNRLLQEEISNQQNAEEEPKAYFELLGLLALQKYCEINKRISNDPSIICSAKLQAIKLLSLHLQGLGISIKDIFPWTNPEPFLRKKICKSIATEMIKIYESIHEIYEFPVIDFLKLTETLPELLLPYGAYLLKHNLEEPFKKLFAQLPNRDLDEIDNSYLLALYHRQNNKEDQSELFLNKFQAAKEQIQKRSKLKPIGNQKFFTPSETLPKWSSVLEECDEIQKKIEEMNFLHPQTCEYFECSDCCKETFPTMTETEFLHLQNWMKANKYPIQEIIEKSKVIQKTHKELFGEELSIITDPITEHQIKAAENPNNFKFTCPFLKNNSCSCYEARPLICRGFGLSTDNAISMKACNYYRVQYQSNNHPELERPIYDLRQAQMLASSGDKFRNNGNILKGTIVAWFSKES